MSGRGWRRGAVSGPVAVRGCLLLSRRSSLGSALLSALSPARACLYFLQPFFLGGVTQSAYAAVLASGAFHVLIGCLRILSLDPNLWLIFLFGC